MQTINHFKAALIEAEMERILVFSVLQMGDSDSLAEELGEVSGFIDVVYREMCAAHAAELAALEERKVTDTAELLQTLAQFPETQFKQYLAAEAPVLRKNSRRSQQLREEGNRSCALLRNFPVSGIQGPLDDRSW